MLQLDGRRYEVLEGRGQRELDRLRATVAEEYSHEEKFGRRADGTDALFNADAELIVSFPGELIPMGYFKTYIVIKI